MRSLLALLALLPITASAATYKLHWRTTSYLSQGSNVSVWPVHGNDFFGVNDVPLPTYVVPGTHVRYANGDESNQATAAFDSVLLRVGTNVFRFSVQNSSGDSSKDLTYEEVDLLAPGAPPYRLFQFHRVGVPFWGETHKELTLRQVDPSLADLLANLDAKINAELDELIKHAQEIPDLEAKLDRLSGLMPEIEALLLKGFDQITAAELAAILAKYADLSQPIRDALVKLLEDLKKDIETLRQELERISSEFRMQVDQLDAAIAPKSPAPPPPSIDPNGMPPVSIPSILGTDDFDAQHDPYAAYADEVLAQLALHTSADSVTNRDGFLGVYEVWRDNQAAIERALQLRATVSQSEYAAFLNARNRVFGFVRRFLDQNDWFKDAPIPQQLKDLVDGVMAIRMAQHIKAVKGGLNRWPFPAPTPQQQLIIDTLLALGGAMESLDQGAAAEDPEAAGTLARIANGAVGMVKEAGKLAVSLSPAGDAIDFCEVVTGRDFCNPNGEQLSTGGRVLSAAGLIVGSGKLWRGVGKYIGIGGRKVADAAGKFVDGLHGLVSAERRALVARMKKLKPSVVTDVGDIASKEVKHLLDGLGDRAVDELAAALKGTGLKDLHAFKMFSPSKFDPRFAQILGNANVAARKLPPFKGKTLTEVKDALKNAGFQQYPNVGPVADEIFMHADGSLVRISAGTTERPFLHIKKEISEFPGRWDTNAVICKLTDAGELAPAGPSFARSQLAAWFKNVVGRDPLQVATGANPVEELDALVQAWAELTHVALK